MYQFFRGCFKTLVLERYFGMWIFWLFTLFAVGNSHAVTPFSWSPWVSKDWKLLKVVTGPLDQTGNVYAVMVIEQTLKKNFIKNDGLGTPLLNTNPRQMLLLKFTNNTYEKVAQYTRFLPSENVVDNGCIADPLELDLLKIENKLLKISLSQFMSCGGWGAGREDLTFRLESGQFRLTGFDAKNFDRGSGEAHDVSINYLTSRRKDVTGHNMFEGSKKSQTRWSLLKSNKPLYMGQLDLSCPENNLLSPSCSRE